MNLLNKKKLLIGILLTFSLVLSITIILAEELFFEHDNEQLMLRHAVTITEERSDFLQKHLGRSQQNLLAIRESPHFQKYLQNDTNHDSVELIFTAFALEHSDIKQIRYIDEKGYEKIKVGRESENGDPSAVPKDELQNKSNRYYFLDSKDKELEKIWFSAIELNKKNGKVKHPSKPTIRAILPLKKDGKFAGILIINSFIKEHIQKLTVIPLYDVILFNDKGYIIYSSKEGNKGWGNSSAIKNHIASEFPINYYEILNTPLLKTNSFVSKKIDLPIYGGINLMLRMKDSYLNQRKKNALTRYLTLAFIVFILSVFLTYIIIKIFSRTLLNLDKITELNESLNEASKVAKIGFWEFDNTRGKVKWSDSVYDILEIEKKDIKPTYETFMLFVDEDDKEALELEITNSIDEKRDYYITHKIITNKNRLKFVEQRGRHYFDDTGRLFKTIGSVYDITEKYYSEQKFLSLLENASDGIHILDKEGNLIYFSKSFASNLGYGFEEVKSLTVDDWDNAITKDQVKDAIQALLESPKTYETKHRKKDGTIIDVQINAKGVEIEGETYLYASQRDITLQNIYKKELEATKDKLVKTNEELQKSLENLQSTTKLYENEKIKYKGILDLASDGIFLMDTDGKLIEYSKKVMELLGYELSEMNDLTVFDWDKSFTKKEFQELVNILYSQPIEIEREHTRKDGSTYIAYITATLQYLEGKPYIYSSVRDITKQKEAELEVLKSRNEFETIFNTALEGIALIDLDKKYKRVNKKYCDILGYKENEILQLDFFEITDPQDHEKSKDIFNLVLKKGYYENFERFCITKNGEKRRFRTSIALLPNEKEYLITSIDNTELYDAFKKIEQQSYTDDLTQTGNRKAYNDRICELLEEHKRYGNAFSLIIFDIDHFKSINDTYGHDVGDQVLKKLSNVVKAIIRNNDFFFRVGGEEFVVLASNTELSDAEVLAEKIRTTVETKVNTIKDRVITISVGLSQIQKGDTEDSLFKRADVCLFHSKENGRNRVTVHSKKAGQL